MKTFIREIFKEKLCVNSTSGHSWMERVSDKPHAFEVAGGCRATPFKQHKTRIGAEREKQEIDAFNLKHGYNTK